MNGDLQREWEDFFAACFPDGGEAAGQSDEMRRAFFAGAFVALNRVFPPFQMSRWEALREEASRELDAMIRRDAADGG